MSWLYANRYLLARRGVQLSLLVLFWLGAKSHLDVLTGNLSSSRVFRTVPLSDPLAVLQILATQNSVGSTALLGAALVLIFYFLVGGRAFCAWTCPINLVSDAARVVKRRFKPSRTFSIAPSARYWVLALALILSALTGVAAFERVSPIAIFQRELIFGPGLGLAVVLVIFALDAGVLRQGWCASLCPLGALYALVGRYSLWRVGFDEHACDRCGQCLPACPSPQVIQFESMTQKGFIDSGDCSNCARCIEVCPRAAYRMRSRLGGPHRTDASTSGNG